MNRRLASFLLPFGCVSLSLGVIAACEDDPNPTSPGFDAQAPGFDARRDPTDSSIPDTGLPDVVDAGPLPVTVLVKSVTGQAIAGATVVFGSATGDVIQSATTDATGKASEIVPSGSQVTVVLPNVADQPRLLTVTAVEPGDVILTSDLLTVFSPNPSTVSFATEPDGGAGAIFYRYSSGECQNQSAGNTGPFEYPLQPWCIGPAGKFPVLVEAFDDSSTLVGFFFSKNNTALTDGGVFSPTLGALTTTQTTQTLSGSDLHRDGGTNYFGFGEIADGVMHPAPVQYVDPGDGGPQTATFTGHTGYAEAAQYEVAANSYIGNGRIVVANAVRTNAPAVNGTTSIDFGTRLPEINGSTINGVTPKRPVVTWAPTASLATADGTYVIMRWSEDIDASTVNGTWAFVTPPSATTLTAPALPASVTVGPGAGANYNLSGLPRIITIEASFVNGYSEFRKGAGAVAPRRRLVEQDGPMYVPPLPANGTVKFTAFTVNGD